jgi:hypothetical protein
MMLKLSGGNLTKPVRLNPYKRAKLGTEHDILVNGQEVKALIPPKGKYTYLTVDGVEYYVSAELAAGNEFTSAVEEPKPAVAKEPKAPKEPKAGKADRAPAEAAA